MDLSVILPAFNEEHRLRAGLTAVLEHLQADGRRFELLVVNDGSTDGTANLAREYERSHPEVRLLAHRENRGKGAAVRTGMMAARGDTLLFTDADGATPIDHEAKLAAAIRDGADVAIGSRLLPGAGVVRRRTLLRGLAGRLFAGVARWWLKISVRDTQCGFKMFRREVGRRLFSQSHESGYLFDLELLAMAAQLGCRVDEVPINWADVPGGHLSLSRQMGGALVGLWRLGRRQKKRRDSMAG